MDLVFLLPVIYWYYDRGTLNDLAYNRELRFITDIIFLDFSKAFDGLSVIANFWLKFVVLMGRGQVVKVADAISRHYVMSSGLPQGSVLEPLLFLIFVNDLPEQISSECRLFADDALLYSTRDKSHVLQEDLKKLSNLVKSLAIRI